MAALKIFATLFVVCIAQDVVSAGIFRWDKPTQKEETQVATRGLFDFWINPLNCIGHIGETYQVVNEARGLWREYQEIKEIVALLKAQCDKIENETAKENCLKDAEKTETDRNAELVKKFQPLIFRLIELGKKFADCLFGDGTKAIESL